MNSMKSFLIFYSGTPDKDWREVLDVEEMAKNIYKNQYIIPKLFKHARSKIIHQGNKHHLTIILEVATCLANLCANKLCRTEILKCGGISNFI